MASSSEGPSAAESLSTYATIVTTEPLNFCQWWIIAANNDPQFLPRIMWTDEASFTRRGVFSYHNLHTWAHENPHNIRPFSFQYEFSINIWLGFIENHLCGSHILPRGLDSLGFLQFLEQDFYLMQIDWQTGPYSMDSESIRSYPLDFTIWSIIKIMFMKSK